MRRYARYGGIAVIALLLLNLGLMWYADHPAEPFDPVAVAAARAKSKGVPLVLGQTLTLTEIELVQRTLDKPGGYLSNDILPPGVLLDNVPNWEFGVLVQVRDLSRFLRGEFSKSQAQSTEDTDLAEAEPHFAFSNNRWLLPSSESEYRAGISRTESYLDRLADQDQLDAQFYARADNLNLYLGEVERRLGNLSKRLSEGVARTEVAASMGTDPNAPPNASTPAETVRQTPWSQIDDVFYEARGACFAQVHILKAIDHDFARVLDDKNARVALRQIIQELEATQAPLNSPVILNGSPYGFFANHSLVIANYISRANAAIGDLRLQLERG
ncbi:DUF2333 domain-containing protein [Ahniella affigens]|uniref:DUF2333 domain-containing protein n=2 Tax=Ahniella affigens TaxID=2021234 RepID=A0A2P1PZA9_9GAMM|nr:DUF2333 domain-containing protein [Ahniella affigens]